MLASSKQCSPWPRVISTGRLIGVNGATGSSFWQPHVSNSTASSMTSSTSIKRVKILQTTFHP